MTPDEIGLVVFGVLVSIIGYFYVTNENLKKENQARADSQLLLQSDATQDLQLSIKELTTQIKIQNEQQVNFNREIITKHTEQEKFNKDISEKVNTHGVKLKSLEKVVGKVKSEDELKLMIKEAL